MLAVVIDLGDIGVMCDRLGPIPPPPIELKNTKKNIFVKL
jgi:hypothetical protein